MRHISFAGASFFSALGCVVLSFVFTVLFRRHNAVVVQKASCIMWQHVSAVVFLLSAACLFQTFGPDSSHGCTAVFPTLMVISWPCLVVFTVWPTRRAIQAFSVTSRLAKQEAIIIMSSFLLVWTMIIGNSPMVADDVCVTSMSFDMVVVACACLHIAAVWSMQEEARDLAFPFQTRHVVLPFLVVLSVLGGVVVVQRSNRIMSAVDYDGGTQTTTAVVFRNGTIDIRHRWTHVPDRVQHLEILFLCFFAVGTCATKTLPALVHVMRRTYMCVDERRMQRLNGTLPGVWTDGGRVVTDLLGREFALFMEERFSLELYAYQQLWLLFKGFVEKRVSVARSNASGGPDAVEDPLQKTFGGGCPWLGVEKRHDHSTEVKPSKATGGSFEPVITLQNHSDAETALLFAVNSMCQRMEEECSNGCAVELNAGERGVMHPIAHSISMVHSFLSANSRGLIHRPRMWSGRSNAPHLNLNIHSVAFQARIVELGMQCIQPNSFHPGSAFITDAMAFIAVRVATRLQSTFSDFKKGQTQRMYSRLRRAYHHLKTVYMWPERKARHQGNRQAHSDHSLL